MNSKIEVFTPIRGIAAILVVVSHMYFIWERYPAMAFLGNGNFSVIIFFMLSGFVLMYRYRDRFKCRISFGEYKSFIKHRVKKIYPLYALSQLIFFIFVIGGEVIHKGGGVSIFFKYLKQLIYSVTMLQSLVPFESVCLVLNTSLWYISVLFVFYLITPVLVRAINSILKNNTILKSLSAILVVLFIYVFADKGFVCMSEWLQDVFPEENIVLGIATPYINIFYFVIGMLICKFYSICKEQMTEETISFSVASVVECVLGVGLLYLNFSWADRKFSIVAITLCIMLISFQKGLLTKLLCRCKPIVFLGNISFHIYVLHFVYTGIFAYIFRMIFPDTLMSFIILFISLWILIVLSAYIAFRIEKRWQARNIK
ncbi:MAG: acyltransferase [Lachnospiraceae bacterium]|nr:acyltransferase [Lachnospiraceae bacterium]